MSFSNAKKVSVIIPVYNVQDYVDRCIESVVNQEYENLEILVMEGESQDNSLEIVNKWAQIDSRITVVSRKDGGLGPARNYALNMATGYYVIFVDSDDWIDSNTIKEMVKLAEKDNDIDIVMCDAKRYSGERIIDTIGTEWVKESYSTEAEKKCILCFASNFIWGKLYKRELFSNYGITQPALPFEDLAVFPALLALAKKIVTCHGVYANYQMGRTDSLSQAKDTYKKLPEVYYWGEKELKRVQLYEQWKDAFLLSMYIHFRIICKHCLGNQKYAKLKTIDTEMDSFFEKHFAIYRKSSYIAYGGFSLRWITHECYNGFECLDRHFCFTTIPAQMSHPRKRIGLKSNNTFRQECLMNDAQGSLFEYLDDNAKRVFLIDFTQECTNVLCCNDGNYISCSEAFDTGGVTDDEDANYLENAIELQWSDNRYIELWKKMCLKMITNLKAYKNVRVFLVENYFSDEFISGTTKVKYMKSVEDKNSILSEMYSFFKEECDFCTVIKPDKSLCFTDMSGRSYSPSPEYYNTSYYRNIAISIQEKLFDIFKSC